MDKGIPFKEYLRRWDNEDRARVQAVLAENALRCQMCGTADWEWVTDSSFRAVESVCQGCAAKDRKRAGSETGGQIPGSSIRLVPEEVAVRTETIRTGRPKSARERAKEQQ